MASYLTKIRPEQKAQTQIAYEPIMFALAARQQRFDTEYAKFEAFASNLADLDLAKEEDAKYFENNLKTVYDEVRKAGGVGDLSLTGASRIKSYVGQAADDKVVNGYVSTKQIRNLQQDWEKLKEKNPELYNQVNYDYSMLNVNDYLNDETVGTKLMSYSNPYTGKGAGQAIQYTNVIDRANEIIKEIEPESYVTLSQTGSFEFFKVNGEKLTDTSIIQALETQLLGDSQVAQQMKINSWGNYRYVSDEQFAQDYRAMYDGNISKYDEAIDELNIELAITGDDKRAEEIEESINYLKQKKDGLGKFVNQTDDEIIKQRPSIQTQLYVNDFMQGMANTYQYNKVKDKDFITSPEQMARWKDSQEQRRFNQRLALDRKKLSAKATNNSLKLVEKWHESSDNPALQKVYENKIIEDLTLSYELNGVSSNKAANMAYASADNMLRGNLYAQTPGDITGDEEESNNAITSQAFQVRDMNLYNLEKLTTNWVKEHIEPSKHGQFINPKTGELHLGLLDKLYSEGSGFLTGKYLKPKFRTGADVVSALAALSDYKTDLYNVYKGTDDIIKKYTTEAENDKSEEILDNFNKELPKKRTVTGDLLGKGSAMANFNIFSGLLGESSNKIYHKSIDFGIARGEGILGKQYKYEVLTDEVGNPLKDKQDNLILAKIEKFDETEVITIDKNAPKVRSVEELARAAVAQTNVQVTENIAKDYTNLYGDLVQGTEVDFRGSGDEPGMIVDFINASTAGDDTKNRFSTASAVIENIKTYVETKEGDKEVTTPQAFSLTYNYMQESVFINVNGEKYLVNTNKLSDPVAKRMIQNNFKSAEMKVNANLEKSQDSKDLKLNDGVPLVRMDKNNYNITLSQGFYTNINKIISGDGMGGLKYYPQVDVYSPNGESIGKKNISVLSFPDPLKYKNGVEDYMYVIEQELRKILEKYQQ